MAHFTNVTRAVRYAKPKLDKLFARTLFNKSEKEKEKEKSLVVLREPEIKNSE